MTARIVSVNVGAPAPSRGGRGQPKLTGIDKESVAEIEVRDPGPRTGGGGSGVAGDFIGDSTWHGGDRQAVYAFAVEELHYWSDRLGRTIAPGVFGENLTTEGIDVDGARIGDRWRVGGTLLEVTGPRIPCATFAGAMGERGWVRTFAARGLSGAYLAVVEPGIIRPGDRVEVVHRAGHDISLPLVLRALMRDAEAMREVIAAGIMHAEDQAWLVEQLAKQRR